MKELPPTKAWWGINRFFIYARERYQILLARRAGKPHPWTDDPILQQYRFCNVFREDDTTTEWIRDNIRNKMTKDPLVITAMVVCRFFNRISTLKALAPMILVKGWDERMARGIVQELEPPIVTSAYMLKTPAGKTKFEGIAEILAPIRRDNKKLADKINCRNKTTLKRAWELLREYPYMGNFMAYEVVTDLAYTRLLGTPPDQFTWASAGPGAARGLSRVVYGTTGAYNYHSDGDQATLNEGMQQLLSQANGEFKNWPLEWPTWDMRTVEHTLCEFDKYERTRLNEGRPKQIFRSTQ